MRTPVRGVRLSRTPSGPGPVCGGMGAKDGCDYRPTRGRSVVRGSRGATAASCELALVCAGVTDRLHESRGRDRRPYSKLRAWLAVTGAAAPGIVLAGSRCCRMSASRRAGPASTTARTWPSRCRSRWWTGASCGGSPCSSCGAMGSARRGHAQSPHGRRPRARRGIDRTGPRGPPTAGASSSLCARCRLLPTARRYASSRSRPGRASDPRVLRGVVRQQRGPDDPRRSHAPRLSVYKGGAALRARGGRHPAAGARGQPPGRRRHGARAVCALPRARPRRGLRGDRAARRPHGGLVGAARRGRLPASRPAGATRSFGQSAIVSRP